MSEISRQIIRARKAKGWMQEELAEKIGMSSGLIAHIETERTPVTKDVADKLIDVFKFDAQNFHYKVFVEKIIWDLKESDKKIIVEYKNYPEVLNFHKKLKSICESVISVADDCSETGG